MSQATRIAHRLRTAFPFWFAGILLALGSRSLTGAEFVVSRPEPTLDRWVYPFNFQPGTRPVAPTYGSFDPRFDTRDATLLLGWDTGEAIPTNAGPSRYLLRSVRITLTSVAPVPPTLPFIYDPTYDPYTTYLTNEPGATLDADPGRPIELFGVGYRGGFTDETFLEGSSYGVLGPIAGTNISIGTRNAFAAVFDVKGELVDIGNHVGQKNPGWTNAPFDITPWAVGATTNTPPGGEMPDDGRMTFSVDLDDPRIVSHLQRALHAGRLRFMVSSLSPAGQSTPGGTGAGGVGAYPWWATKENLLYDAPVLEVEGTLVSEDLDTDGDGLPDDWERHWRGTLAESAGDDPDGDGRDHLDEWRAGTDPGNAASAFRIESYDLSVSAPGIRFTVAPSRAYRVEKSPDLVTWTPAEGTTTYPERGIAEWRPLKWRGTDSAEFFRVAIQ